jgi:CHAD domain-containing protein
MKLNPAHSVDANARAVLPKMARKYFEAGRAVIGEKKDPDHLHVFRLKTKRFRYTLELFRPVYGPQLDRYLNSLKSLQSALGKVSDHEAIQRVLGADGALDPLIREELKKKVKDLRHEWRDFDSEGRLKRWRSYLGSQHSRPKTARKRTPAKKTAAKKRS